MGQESSITQTTFEDEYRVFISYSHQDRPEAIEIMEELMKIHGVTVFMAEQSIAGGAHFAEDIRENLERSSEFCLLFSPSCKKSDWILVECGVAIGYQLRITPILLKSEPADLPAMISSRNVKLYHELRDYAQEVAERASPTFLNRFLLGTQQPSKCQVIAHCNDDKFTKYNMIAPGRDIQNTLRDYYNLDASLKIIKEDLNPKKKSRLKEINEIRQMVNPRVNALFLLDSPRSNFLVEHVLDSYGQWVSGGQIRFSKMINPNDYADRDRILIHGKGRELASDRFDLQDPINLHVGPFTDYFLIMRLPGSSLGLLQQNAVAWIIFGIHSKATIAAARLFLPTPLRRLMQKVQVTDEGVKVSPYFEAVFQVPSECSVNQKTIKGFPSVVMEHFGQLRARNVEAASDDLDWRTLPYFLSPMTYDNIKLQIAHIDLTTVCNFHCDGCIETPLRQRSLHFTFPAVVDILCALKDCGCRKVGFYGGEPTLHPEFPRILSTANHLGFDLVLVTNGSQLFKEEIHSAILNCCSIQVRVSIDSGNEKTHAFVHGINDTGLFQMIVNETSRLIKNGVFVNISFLLRPSKSENTGNIAELADSCQFWKNSGAKQFSIRPFTRLGGSSPHLPSESEADQVRSILKNFGDFVSTPDWFRKWLQDGLPPTQLKKYKKCHSALYRVVISPVLQLTEPKGEHPGVPNETDLAWMSFCSYRRYDDPLYDYRNSGEKLESGGEFTKPSVETWLRLRNQYAEKLNPNEHCSDVLCCRHTYNEGVMNYLASMKLRKQNQDSSA